MSKIIIALEGIDGAGKSSTINYLATEYKNQITIYKRTNKSKLVDRIVSSRFMRKHFMFQVPIYLFLSHLNYWKSKSDIKEKQIIIMDRCFLSNICYFFPKAIDDKKLYNILIFFEPKIFPQKIFVLDVTPSIAQSRDLFKKDLSWLNITRLAYLNTTLSEHLKKYSIELLDESTSLKTKSCIVSNYIQEVIKNGTRQKRNT